MKILIVTEAWIQVNGVSTCYQNIVPLLDKEHEVIVIYPQMFKSIKIPFYPEVEMPICPKEVWLKLNDIEFNHIHIATEGILGLIARFYCIRHKIPFTTAYHTNISDYLKKMLWIPKWLTWTYLRWFHSSAKTIFVTTNTIKNLLIDKGFNADKMLVWTRGVNRNIFKSIESKSKKEIVLGYVGRISIEKGLDEFLSLEFDKNVKKVIIGDGPYLPKLKLKYPEVTFLGYKFGHELAELINTFNVFVFPSKTDTFGIVLIEAISCGVPVAAFPVHGPIDIIEEGKTGSLNNSLEIAINNALILNRETILECSKCWTWENCTRIFLEGLT
jgi:glycosyltransferase involved in cell wall biosynthesis